MNTVKDSTEIYDCSPISTGVFYFVHHMEDTDITVEAHRRNYYAVCLLSEGEMSVSSY